MIAGKLVIAKIGNRGIEELQRRRLFNFRLPDFGNYQSEFAFLLN